MPALKRSDAAAALVEASNSGEWITALDMIESAFGVRGCILMAYDGFSRDPAAVLASSFGMRRDRQAEYMADFAALDFRNKFCERQPPGQIIHDYQIGAVKDLDRTPIYAEFLQPLDLGRFVGVNLGVSSARGKSHTFFALSKANDSMPPSEQESAEVLAMGKIARGAVRTASVVSAFRARGDNMFSAIDQIDVGIAFVGADGMLAECNQAARALLDERGAVSVENGRLRFLDPEAERTFELMLRDDPALRAGRTWVARGREDANLVVIASNISAAGAGQPVMTLILADVRRQTRNGFGAWKRLFGLTQSECEVAQGMLEGLSRREIAEARGVADGTVHAQMRALYGKLQVSKLSDAVLLLNATIGR